MNGIPVIVRNHRTNQVAVRNKTGIDWALREVSTPPEHDTNQIVYNTEKGPGEMMIIIT